MGGGRDLKPDCNGLRKERVLVFQRIVLVLFCFLKMKEIKRAKMPIRRILLICQGECC